MSRGNTSKSVRVMTRKPQHLYINTFQHHSLTFLLLVVMALYVDCTKSDPAAPQVTISPVNTDASLHPIASECSKLEKGQVGKAKELVADVTRKNHENESEEDLYVKVTNKKDEQVNQEPSTRRDNTPENLSTNITQEYGDPTDTETRKKPTQHPSHHEKNPTSSPQNNEYPASPKKAPEYLFHHKKHPTSFPKNTEYSTSPQKSSQHPSHHESNITPLRNKAEYADPQITETLEERTKREVNRNFSSLTVSSMESTLLSLAFLTFAVFLVGLVQDLLNGTTTSSASSSGREGRTTTSGLLKLLSLDDDGRDDRLADLIVLTLSSIDTLSYGREKPDCGRKLLCHLNRSGWHDGLIGTASNYLVSLVFSLLSPSGFQDNLDAAKFGRERQDCTSRYASCPSVIGKLLPTL